MFFSPFLRKKVKNAKKLYFVKSTQLLYFGCFLQKRQFKKYDRPTYSEIPLESNTTIFFFWPGLTCLLTKFISISSVGSSTILYNFIWYLPVFNQLSNKILVHTCNDGDISVFLSVEASRAEANLKFVFQTAHIRHGLHCYKWKISEK